MFNLLKSTYRLGDEVPVVNYPEYKVLISVKTMTEIVHFLGRDPTQTPEDTTYVVTQGSKLKAGRVLYKTPGGCYVSK